VSEILASDQNSSNSSASICRQAKHKALTPPALVPIKKSKTSVIFFPRATSSFFRNTTPASTLTPPPSSDKTNLDLFLLRRLSRKLNYWKTPLSKTVSLAEARANLSITMDLWVSRYSLSIFLIDWSLYPTESDIAILLLSVAHA